MTDVTPVAEPVTPANAPSLLDLFIAFATISASGFGGVLAWSRRVIVERRRWMTPEEFTEAYALCQFLPGPNVVNLSVVFGSRFRGPIGAAAALIGLLGPPFLVVLVLAILYAQYGEIAMLQRMLSAVSAAAAGLLIATAVKMAQPLFDRRLATAIGVAIAAFVAVGVMRWPMPLVLAVLVPVSVALAWWGARR
jgi:chromate transporter